jgi:hypothetical protein
MDLLKVMAADSGVFLPLPQNGARGASMLVARAAAGVLRVCQRLLPYRGEAGRALLGSLQLLLRLSPAAAWDLAQPISAEARAVH